MENEDSRWKTSLLDNLDHKFKIQGMNPSERNGLIVHVTLATAKSDEIHRNFPNFMGQNLRNSHTPWMSIVVKNFPTIVFEYIFCNFEFITGNNINYIIGWEVTVQCECMFVHFFHSTVNEEVFRNSKLKTTFH